MFYYVLLIWKERCIFKEKGKPHALPSLFLIHNSTNKDFSQDSTKMLALTKLEHALLSLIFVYHMDNTTKNTNSNKTTIK